MRSKNFHSMFKISTNLGRTWFLLVILSQFLLFNYFQIECHTCACSMHKESAEMVLIVSLFIHHHNLATLTPSRGRSLITARIIFRCVTVLVRYPGCLHRSTTVILRLTVSIPVRLAETTPVLLLVPHCQGFKLGICFFNRSFNLIFSPLI